MLRVAQTNCCDGSYRDRAKNSNKTTARNTIANGVFGSKRLPSCRPCTLLLGKCIQQLLTFRPACALRLQPMEALTRFCSYLCYHKQKHFLNCSVWMQPAAGLKSRDLLLPHCIQNQTHSPAAHWWHWSEPCTFLLASVPALLQRACTIVNFGWFFFCIFCCCSGFQLTKSAVNLSVALIFFPDYWRLC